MQFIGAKYSEIRRRGVFVGLGSGVPVRWRSKRIRFGLNRGTVGDSGRPAGPNLELRFALRHCSATRVLGGSDGQRHFTLAARNPNTDHHFATDLLALAKPKSALAGFW